MRALMGDFLGEERAQERGLRTMGLDRGRLLSEGMEGRQIDLEEEGGLREGETSFLGICKGPTVTQHY